jgi:hypothetical protein
MALNLHAFIIRLHGGLERSSTKTSLTTSVTFYRFSKGLCQVALPRLSQRDERLNVSRANVSPCGTWRQCSTLATIGTQIWKHTFTNVSEIVAILLMGPCTVWTLAVLPHHSPPHPYGGSCSTKNTYMYVYIHENTHPSFLKTYSIYTSETLSADPRV